MAEQSFPAFPVATQDFRRNSVAQAPDFHCPRSGIPNCAVAYVQDSPLVVMQPEQRIGHIEHVGGAVESQKLVNFQDGLPR